MNEIWANRLIAGDKVWSNVPVSRRNAVKASLAARVKRGIIDAELYAEITGDVYENGQGEE